VIIKDYVYPDYNGKDWIANVTKTQAEIQAGVDTQTFYTDMESLVTDLGDNHSRFESPVEVAQAKAELSGINQYVGIGIELLPNRRRIKQPSFPFFTTRLRNMPDYSRTTAFWRSMVYPWGRMAKVIFTCAGARMFRNGAEYQVSRTITAPGDACTAADRQPRADRRPTRTDYGWLTHRLTFLFQPFSTKPSPTNQGCFE